MPAAKKRHGGSETGMAEASAGKVPDKLPPPIAVAIAPLLRGVRIPVALARSSLYPLTGINGSGQIEVVKLRQKARAGFLNDSSFTQIELIGFTADAGERCTTIRRICFTPPFGRMTPRARYTWAPPSGSAARRLRTPCRNRLPLFQRPAPMAAAGWRATP